MIQLFRIRCDNCGKTTTVEALMVDYMPQGWSDCPAHSKHACGESCRNVIDAELERADGKIQIWWTQNEK